MRSVSQAESRHSEAVRQDSESPTTTSSSYSLMRRLIMRTRDSDRDSDAAAAARGGVSRLGVYHHSAAGPWYRSEPPVRSAAKI